MTCPAMANQCETLTPNRSHPPRVRLPKLVQGALLTLFRRNTMRYWIKRHGRIFEFNVPFFGRSVIVSDAALVRSVCTASAEQLTNYEANLAHLFALAAKDAPIRAVQKANTDAASVMAQTMAKTPRVGSNGGTAAGLVGSYDQVAARIQAFHDAGIELFMLQFQPFEAEMRRFAAEVMPRVRRP